MLRVILLATVAAALALPSAAQPVPAPAGLARVLVFDADGVQVYACQARDGGHAWVFQGPEATLFDTEGRQVGTHGTGPHWRLSSDGSRITATVAASIAAPVTGAIPWLLLQVRSHEGEGALARIAWVRRIDTVGGLAPREACDAARAGTDARMRYSATYEFYGG